MHPPKELRDGGGRQALRAAGIPYPGWVDHTSISCRGCGRHLLSYVRGEGLKIGHAAVKCTCGEISTFAP